VIALAGVESDAGHGLRAWFVTAAAQKKLAEVDIMRVSGHRSTAVLRRYVWRPMLFEDAPFTSILRCRRRLKNGLRMTTVVCRPTLGPQHCAWGKRRFEHCALCDLNVVLADTECFANVR